MMTRKQALQFRQRVEAGERPPIPAIMCAILQKSGDSIRRDIRSAILWEYGDDRFQKRMIEMGLLDQDYNRTEIGQEYYGQIYPKSEEP